MKKFLKRLRGTEHPVDFYLWHGGITFTLLMAIVFIIFGQKEQKWGGVIGAILALEFLIVPHLGKHEE